MMSATVTGCASIGWLTRNQGDQMSRNITRAILGILLVAVARKVTDILVERVFGPDEQTA